MKIAQENTKARTSALSLPRFEMTFDETTILGRVAAAMSQRYEQIQPVDDDWLEQLAAAALVQVAAEMVKERNVNGRTFAQVALAFLREGAKIRPFPEAWRPRSGAGPAE
jgi:hypothetical protein